MNNGADCSVTTLCNIRRSCATWADLLRSSVKPTIWSARTLNEKGSSHSKRKHAPVRGRSRR